LSADEMGDIRFSRLADNADSYDRFEWEWQKFKYNI
jgi:hypothetical protein